MAYFFPEGIPPLTEAEENNKAVFRQLYGGAAPEQLLRESATLPYPRTTSAMETIQHAPWGPEEVMKLHTAKQLDVVGNLHERYFPVGMHTHEGIELLCVLRGACPHRVADTRGTLQEGDVLLIAPGTQHAFLAVSDDCLIYNLFFPLEHFEAAFQPVLRSQSELSTFLLKTLYTGSRNSWMLFHLGDYFRGDNHLAEFHEAWFHPTPLLRERINAVAQLFLLDLLERSARPPEVSLDTQPGGDARAQAMIAYVRGHAGTASVQDLSQVFNYSTRQVSRIFRQVTGQSCIDFIQTCRQEQFLALLVGSDISISRALELAGIRSVSQFFSEFRGRYGMSPAEYRQTYRKNA